MLPEETGGGGRNPAERRRQRAEKQKSCDQLLFSPSIHLRSLSRVRSPPPPIQNAHSGVTRSLSSRKVREGAEPRGDNSQ